MKLKLGFSGALQGLQCEGLVNQKRVRFWRTTKDRMQGNFIGNCSSSYSAKVGLPFDVMRSKP